MVVQVREKHPDFLHQFDDASGTKITDTLPQTEKVDPEEAKQLQKKKQLQQLQQLVGDPARVEKLAVGHCLPRHACCQMSVSSTDMIPHHPLMACLECAAYGGR